MGAKVLRSAGESSKRVRGVWLGGCAWVLSLGIFGPVGVSRAWASLETARDVARDSARDASRTLASEVSKEGALADRLSALRERLLQLEGGLIESLQNKKNPKANLKYIQSLLKLQNEERQLAQERLKELEQMVGELELRRGQLQERVQLQRKSLRRQLHTLDRTLREAPARDRGPAVLDWLEQERLDAPRRVALSRLSERTIKEIETLKIDIADAAMLEKQLEQEMQQLQSLFQDMQEKESVLKLSRQLQLELLKSRHEASVSRLEKYHEIKNSEANVERMLGDFNARRELEKIQKAPESAAFPVQPGSADQQAAALSDFFRMKGSLPLPVLHSKVVQEFGRGFDPSSKLQVFRKGIELSAPAASEVKAIYSGKVAFAGELPHYGTVAIVDHGDHFYSLVGRLGKIGVAAGQAIRAGASLGQMDASGRPLYFEIRSKNVPVNPLQWVRH